MPKALKLIPERVPRPLWKVSAYRLLKGARWDRIRAAVKTADDHRCSICRTNEAPEGYHTSQLYCHEIWRYNEKKSVATLHGLHMVCIGCNSVLHIGHTSTIGTAEYALALQHLARVNGVPAERANRIVAAARLQWRRRSQLKWSVEVAPSLLARYPDLGRLPSCILPATRD